MGTREARAALELFTEYVQEKDRIELARGMIGEVDESNLDAIAERLAALLP